MDKLLLWPDGDHCWDEDYEDNYWKSDDYIVLEWTDGADVNKDKVIGYFGEKAWDGIYAEYHEWFEG